jgi:hypothetical protein
MNLPKVKEAMSVINASQLKLWKLQHKVKKYNEVLSEEIWYETLQIEHALLILNEEILGGESYLEPS